MWEPYTKGLQHRRGNEGGTILENESRSRNQLGATSSARSLYQKHGHARLDASIVSVGKEYTPPKRFMNNRATLTSTWAKSIDDVGASVVVSPIGSGQRELKDGDIYLTSPGYISPGGSLDPCSDLFYADELPLYTPSSALLLSVIPKSQQTAGVQRVTPRVYGI